MIVKFLALCLYFGCYDLITTGVPTYTIIGCWICRYVLTVSFEVVCFVSQDTETIFLKFSLEKSKLVPYFCLVKTQQKLRNTSIAFMFIL